MATLSIRNNADLFEFMVICALICAGETNSYLPLPSDVEKLLLSRELRAGYVDADPVARESFAVSCGRTSA